MNQSTRAATREERLKELVDHWATGRQGQAIVLRLCHRALSKGETLKAGMSVFEVILDREFGKASSLSKMDASETSEKPSLLLQRALKLFRGHASCAYLGEVHRMAVEQTGFEGSLEEAAAAIMEIPDVRLELAPVLDQSRVYASAYWSATS